MLLGSNYSSKNVYVNIMNLLRAKEALATKTPGLEEAQSLFRGA